MDDKIFYNLFIPKLNFYDFQNDSVMKYKIYIHFILIEKNLIFAFSIFVWKFYKLFGFENIIGFSSEFMF